MTAAQQTQTAEDKLVADFKMVVSDAEELLKTTASSNR